jgi:hypothetical protein
MLALLGAVPLLYRLIAVGVVVAALGGAAVAYHHHVYEQGYAKAISDVAAADQAAVERVGDGKATIAACRASGHKWDVTTGECK